MKKCTRFFSLNYTHSSGLAQHTTSYINYLSWLELLHDAVANKTKANTSLSASQGTISPPLHHLWLLLIFLPNEIVFYGFRLVQSMVFLHRCFREEVAGMQSMTHPFRGPGTVKQAETNCGRRQNTSYLHYKQRKQTTNKLTKKSSVYIIS